MPTIQEINSAIINSDFDNDQLQSIIDAVKYRRSRLTRNTIFSLRVGDTVSFTDKRGIKTTGTVTAIKQKYVHVQVGYTTWKVPANMLTVEQKVPA